MNFSEIFDTLMLIWAVFVLFEIFIRLPWIKRNFDRHTNQTNSYLKTLMNIPGGLGSFYEGMMDEYFDNLPINAFNKAVLKFWVWDLREFVKDKEMYDRVMGSELK